MYEYEPCTANDCRSVPTFRSSALSWRRWPSLVSSLCEMNCDLRWLMELHNVQMYGLIEAPQLTTYSQLYGPTPMLSLSYRRIAALLELLSTGFAVATATKAHTTKITFILVTGRNSTILFVRLFTWQWQGTLFNLDLLYTAGPNSGSTHLTFFFFTASPFACKIRNDFSS